jgi:hypothetical protein
MLMKASRRIDRFGLVAFVISPDSTQALVTESGGETLLLGLTDGHIDRLVPAMTRFEPAWRRPGEFTYLRNDAGRRDLVLAASALRPRMT